MRIYKNCMEMVKEEERNLMELGIEVQPYSYQDKVVQGDPDYFTKEIRGAVFTITSGQSDKNALLEHFEIPQLWADVEFQERIDPNMTHNPGNAYKFREEVWGQFIKAGRFTYCVTAGSLVRTPDGEVKIENVRSGDTVFNGFGKEVIVKNTFMFSNKPTRRIVCHYDYELSGTLNHPLYAIKSRGQKHHTTNKEPDWINIEDLEVGDYIAISNHYPTKYALDTDLAFLFGLVLSDGSFIRKGYLGINFTNTDKRLSDLFEELANKFNFSNRQSYNKAGFWFNVLHREASRQFWAKYQEFESGITFQADHSILSFLAGFAEGDGYFCKKRADIEFCTSGRHPEQAELVKLALNKLGYLCTQSEDFGPYGTFPQIKVKVQGNQARELLAQLPMRVKQKPEWSDKTSYSGKHRFITKNGFTMIQIRKIEELPDQTVYDIETDGSFICNSIISHNSYSERINANQQLTRIKEELLRHGATRQAVIDIHNNALDIKNLGGGGRIPCSLNYGFYIREGKLELFYTMRSCDFLNHFGADIWMALSLQQHVVDSYNAPLREHEPHIECGNFTYFCFSLHAYRRDLIKRGMF